MTAAEIAGFHADHYRPANIVVAAAGQVDHAALVAALAARLGDRTGGAAPARRPRRARRSSGPCWSGPPSRSHVAVGMPGPDRDDEDRHAVGVVEHVLGGGMSSRLFQSVREERGLAYAVYSYRLGFQGEGALAVYAGTSPAHTSEVLDLISAEIDRMAEEGVTAAELAAAKSHVRGAMALGLEDSGARMSRIGHRVNWCTRRVLTLDEVEARAFRQSPSTTSTDAGGSRVAVPTQDGWRASARLTGGRAGPARLISLGAASRGYRGGGTHGRHRVRGRHRPLLIWSSWPPSTPARRSDGRGLGAVSGPVVDHG